MHLGLRLCPQLALRQQLKQELRLELRLARPDGMSFNEPPPMKEVEMLQGKPTIRIAESELDSFACAALAFAKILENVIPDIVLISMRGALPIFRASMQMFNPCFIDDEHRGRPGWQVRRVTIPVHEDVPPDLMNSLDKRGTSWLELLMRRFSRAATFLAVKVKTSYFLDDLSGNLEEDLSRAFSGKKRDGPLTAVFLDTSVTGTKLSWFLPQFVEGMAEAQEALERKVHLVNVIVHHAKPGLIEVGERKQESDGLYVTRCDLGVESLIAEDSPTLLGSRYRQESIDHRAMEVVRACEVPVRASLLVGKRLFDVNRDDTRASASLLARIAGDRARILCREGEI